ncbi:MAG: divergent polysaccharide deacetylase family protein, partial [Sphingomonadales bacterium]
QNGTNPLEQSVIGEVNEAGQPSLTEVVGSNDPVAVLRLPPGNVPVADAAADIPGQKLMQQRLANAVPPPEGLATPPGGITPPEEGILSGPNFAGEEDKPWRRFAVAAPLDTAGKGRIVIVIDDMGNNSAMANSFSQLDGPLNFAFLPYAPNLRRQTALMRASGHELLVHMPMEPNGNENPGPRALLTSLTRAELLAAIEWNLTRFDGYVGVNNHMGSRFTKDEAGMALVMVELQKRGLLFLDSRTAPNSEGARLASRMGMPWAGRDIFLDNEINDAAILRQLLQVERLAKSRGQVIAIGHPYGATLRVLRDWIPTLEGKGLVLVPLSSVVEFNPNPKLAELQGD